jgi:hypothetical protein
VIKQRSHKFHNESFNLKKLNKVEGKEKYHVEVSIRFAALEDLLVDYLKTLYEKVNMKSDGHTMRDDEADIKRTKANFKVLSWHFLDRRKPQKTCYSSQHSSPIFKLGTY